MKINRLFDLVGKAGLKFDLYSSYRPIPLNLKSLTEFGRTAPASKSFEFLKNELPVRIAHILQEIRLLPDTLLSTQPVRDIVKMYEDTFVTLLKYENCDSKRPSIISEFTDDLHEIVDKHSNVVMFMAMGIKEMKENYPDSWDEERRMQYFLDRFYISRIGIRMLITQHTLVYGPMLRENETYVGCIDPQCSPLEQAISAYGFARMLCTRVYGRAPGCDIQVLDRVPGDDNSPELDVTVDADGNPDGAHELFAQKPDCSNLAVRGRNITFCYVPGHLFHMLFELSKNAMRAVVERYKDEETLPRLQVVICNAPEDVTIRLNDRGSGMSYQTSVQAFKYTFTTASHLGPLVDDEQDCVPTSRLGVDPERATYSPLAGRGHGLPLSRLYARYLGGELALNSVEGYGSSALIYLKRLPETANELLPLFTRTTRAFYQCSDSGEDWISGSAIRNDENGFRPSLNP
ncbi:unnamed protein product [Echinostoma caproni]|uniref:Protein-serine/threonine kinase n=1 Tax=Echinostoma caproni TaxID=27848 RepID=A0A183AE64_9TREM|nr:unnamed protein product [Echinostoma caproni]